jgi:hypothetical protein
MGEADRVWRLVRGDELVAELVVTGGDFPWLNARTDGQFLSFCFTSRAKMRGSDGAMNPFQKWKRALTVTSSSAALRAYHRTVARGIGLLISVLDPAGGYRARAPRALSCRPGAVRRTRARSARRHPPGRPHMPLTGLSPTRCVSPKRWLFLPTINGPRSPRPGNWMRGWNSTRAA